MKKKPGTALVVPTIAQLTTVAGPSNNQITEVSALAQRQVQMEDRVAGLTSELADATRQLHQCKTVDLPLAMAAAQIRGITLPDGSKIQVEDVVAANIKEENQPAAHAWLRKHNLGSLIKNIVAMSFGKGEDKKAASVKKWLHKENIPFESKEGVHPQTLKAFVRECLQAGKALPPSIDYTTVPTSKITRSK